mgnify:CR=1 FL=1
MATFTTSYEPQKALKMLFDFDGGDALGAKVKNGEDNGGLNYKVTSGTNRPEVQIAYEEFLIRATAYQDLTLVSPCINRLVVDTNQIADYDTIDEGVFYFSQPYINLIYRDDYHAVSSSLPTVSQLMGFIYKDTNGDIHNIAPNNLVYTQNPASIINTSGASQSYPFDFFGFSNKYYRGASAELSATYKIFKDKGGAIKYLNTGDDSGEIGDDTGDSVGKDREYTLYYYADVYKTQFSHRNPSTFVRRDKIEFVVSMYDPKKDMPIAKFNRGVIGWVDDDNGSNGMNLRFMKNTTVNNLIEIRVNGVKVDNFDFSAVHSTYKNNYKDGNYYYYAKINTNMYIFDSLANAQGLIDDLNDKLNGLLHGGQNGDTVETNLNTNSVDYGCGMSETFILTKAQMLELAQRFNTVVSSEGNILSGMFIGLGMHNNPIDVCIDLFALPIVVDDFVVTTKSHISLGVTHTPSNDTTV